MELDEKRLKLIYVLKIGYNSKNEGLYEFIFSEDEANIDIEGWMWDIEPACNNALPPTEEFINAVISLKTSTFELNCLHEAVDRPYMHGFHTIHALAYEDERQGEESNGFAQYDSLFNKEEEEQPLLVFHYGMSLARIKDMLSGRKIILRNNEFIQTSSIKID